MGNKEDEDDDEDDGNDDDKFDGFSGDPERLKAFNVSKVKFLSVVYVMLEKVKNNLKDKKVDIVNVIERLSAHPGLPTALI